MRSSFAASLLLACGCFTQGRPVSRALDELSAPTGWQRVEPKLTVDADGALYMPPDVAGDPQPAPFMDRLREVQRRQLTPTVLGPERSCRSIVGGDAAPDGTVYVLVHGIGGMGDEWISVVPTLARARPAAHYAYGWTSYTLRGVILDELQRGLEHLAACYPRSRIVLLGHSAGGVLGAFVASRLAVADRPAPVDIITVASPLSGVGVRPPIDDADDDTHFFNDLGSVRRAYPAAAPNVRVLHLRTHWPADPVMKPNRAGYAPNALSAAVKGARVADLPYSLDHDDALLWVARELAAGRLDDLISESARW